MSFKRNFVAAKRVLSFDASIFVGWWYSNEICYSDEPKGVRVSIWIDLPLGRTQNLAKVKNTSEKIV